KKLFELVTSGGKVFFIETSPFKSPGWKDHEARDKEVQEWINKMKKHEDRCFVVEKPGKDHTSWFRMMQEKYHIDPYLQIHSPNKFISQVRYQAKDVEILILI